MPDFQVPIVIRGKIFDESDAQFGGRRGGPSFSTGKISRHLDQLGLGEPSDLADLYALSFADILDYLGELGDRLDFRRNVHMQEAFALSSQTSGLTDNILRHTYESVGRVFAPAFVREYADNAIGIPYLEGWVEKRMANGATVGIRAFGARAVHVIAGNLPTSGAMAIIRNAISRSDAIIKTPSNDPMTAAAIGRTMVEMAPDHPISRHVSVAYWKGGDAEVEDALYQPRFVEKIIAWGGFASVTHVAKYVQPGIDLITLDPKLSSSIIGQEAFSDEARMRAVAERLAIDIGYWNQEGCLNARVVYIQTGTDARGLETADRFGKLVYDAVRALPSQISDEARWMDPNLVEELEALRFDDSFYKLHGGGREGGVIVSMSSDPVDFARLLAHRVANLVPLDDTETAVKSVNAYTQTIGIYPESLKTSLRDRLTFHGAQRFVSLGYAPKSSFAGPHDGMEPLRRMCKWIIDEAYLPDTTPLLSRMEG